MREAWPADVVSCRFPSWAKTHHGRGAHLDGGDAAFRVALREMAIAHRVECPVDVDRDEQARAFGQLFGVDVATVFARRHGAQALLGDRLACRHGIFRVGRKGDAAARHEVGLPPRPGL